MKKISSLVIITLANYIAFAQTTEPAKTENKEPIVKFSGHIAYEAYYDSYESVYIREGNLYLFPKAQSLDANGTDINKHGQLTMLSAQSRLRAKINGPEAFGAKLSGMVEIDFLGRGGKPVDASGNSMEFVQTPRIRHMFINLTWEKMQLLFGQSWHPVFVTECFPEVLSNGAALPFNPLNRASQIKATYKLTEQIELTGAALTHFDHISTGPVDAQKNAVLPDFHFSLKYKTSNLTTGLVGGYKLLRPRLVTTTNVITKKTIGSYDVAAFASFKTGNLTLKAYGIYGQNTSAYVMIGGYGAAQDPLLNDDYDYSNINTMAVWSEGIYKLGAIEVGLFAGYSANVSSSETNYYSLTGYTRGGNIDNIFRISPRITYTSGRMLFGLEHMLTSATYMTLDATNGKYDATATADPVTNHRINFTAKFSF